MEAFFCFEQYVKTKYFNVIVFYLIPYLFKKGEEKNKIEMIKAFIKIGKLSLEEIATAAKVPLDYVVNIANS